MKSGMTGSAFLALLLGGCVSAPLSELEQSERNGSQISQALAGEYTQFATVEVNDMLDFKDGEYFAVKGLQAAQGGEPVPESVTRWRLPEPDADRLQAARNRLVAALANRPEGTASKTAAVAQVGYDCWVEQQEEGFQPQDIDQCRARFMASVDNLEKRKDYPHSIFFALDEARLDSNDVARVNALAEKALRLDVPRITVLGHADRAGGERHNLRLSLRRADAVGRALIQAGIDPGRVGVAAAGEARQRVRTRDGMAERMNRRVELLFQPAVGW